jgi:DinB superfamily
VSNTVDNQLKKLQQQIGAATAGLSAEQLSWHPPGKWSAAEVLEHLYLTYTGTIKGLERVVAAGKPLTTAASWQQRGRKWVVLGLGYLPSGREAPAFARPRGVAAEKVLTEVDLKIAEMDAMLGQCEEKFGRGVLLDHPILGPLNGAGWRKFHLVHGMHHVKQIRRLRAGSGG